MKKGVLSEALTKPEQVSVAVIDRAGVDRSAIVEALKCLQFKVVNIDAQADSLIDEIGFDRVDWIVVGVHNAEDSSLFAIFEGIKRSSCTREPLVTLIHSKDQAFMTPKAFEVGLFSAHLRCPDYDGYLLTFTRLCKLAQVYGGDSVLVSAEYARSYLKAEKCYKELKDLEKHLLERYPGNAKILCHLAEAVLLNGELREGRSYLYQAVILNEALLPFCSKLGQTYIPDFDSVDLEDTEHEQVLGIRHAIIIDSDSDVLFFARKLLTKLGVSDLHAFENGDSAWCWLRETHHHPELVVMEWKLPQIPGPALIQRIRKKFPNCPIVVTSALVRESDREALIEFGVDDLIAKPFSEKDFYRSVIWSLQKMRNPADEPSIFLKVRRHLNLKQFEEAWEIVKFFCADERFSKGRKEEMCAEYFFASGAWERARTHAMQAIAAGEHSLQVLNLLGKSSLKLGRNEEAFTCFERANEISNLSVERLASLANVSLQLQDLDKAKEAVESAKKLDAQAPEIIEAECKLSLERGDHQKLKTLVARLDSGEGFVAYLNNRAITLAKNAHYQECIGLYTRALDCVPDDWQQARSTIIYNLALALARKGDYPKSLRVLNDADQSTGSRLHDKVNALRKSLQRCISLDTSLRFTAKEDFKQIGTSATSAQDTAHTTGHQAGDIDLDTNVVLAKASSHYCCRSLFSVASSDQRLDKLQSQSPCSLADSD